MDPSSDDGLVEGARSRKDQALYVERPPASAKPAVHLDRHQRPVDEPRRLVSKTDVRDVDGQLEFAARDSERTAVAPHRDPTEQTIAPAPHESRTPAIIVRPADNPQSIDNVADHAARSALLASADPPLHAPRPDHRHDEAVAAGPEQRDSTNARDAARAAFPVPTRPRSGDPARRDDRPTERGSAVEPVIQVTIGRVEVKASVTESRQKPRPPSGASSLDDYLRQRSGRSRP
jgi:hypothetical protein